MDPDTADTRDEQPAAASPSGLTDELARRLSLRDQVCIFVLYCALPYSRGLAECVYRSCLRAPRCDLEGRTFIPSIGVMQTVCYSGGTTPCQRSTRASTFLFGGEPISCSDSDSSGSTFGEPPSQRTRQLSHAALPTLLTSAPSSDQSLSAVEMSRQAVSACFAGLQMHSALT